jgi:hypothetical protein
MSLQIYAFPDKTYACLPNEQAIMRNFYVKKMRFFHLALSLFILSFFALFLMAILKMNGTLAAIPIVTAFISLIVGAVSAFAIRRPRCPLCSGKMGKQWVRILPASKALFFVCEHDKKYVYSFVIEGRGTVR